VSFFSPPFHYYFYDSPFPSSSVLQPLCWLIMHNTHNGLQ
jgi:hypothetical protein